MAKNIAIVLARLNRIFTPVSVIAPNANATIATIKIANANPIEYQKNLVLISVNFRLKIL